MSWDLHALQAEIGKSVGEYAALVAEERITVEAGLVTVVMRLDGALREVVVDPRALRRHGADGLADVLTGAIKTAEHRAAGRRDELAGEVTFLGHPVLEVVREMVSDPESAVRRLAADPQMRR